MDIKTELNNLFPNLPNDYNYELIPKKDGLLFNCVAYTLDIYDDWIWTNESWPWKNIPRTPIIESYKSFYKFHNYIDCDNYFYELGYDKIAFYSLNNIPKHVCKQHNDMWKSKIGELPVILEHKLDWLINNTNSSISYGDISFIMKRKRK